MSTVNGGARYSPSNCILPKENPKNVLFSIDIGDGGSTQLSLKQLLDEVVTGFQTLYFYNRNNVGIEVTVSDTSQTIYVPPNTAGYIPILVGNDGFLDLKPDGVGANAVELHFINVPVYPVLIPLVSLVL